MMEATDAGGEDEEDASDNEMVLVFFVSTIENLK
jgi:hypothetical protein